MLSNYRTPIRWMLALTMVLVLSLGVVGTAQAFEFIENEAVPGDEVVNDDLFIVGDRVVIDGTVNGDLFAFGQSVIVNGVVNGSVFTGAQTVEINGEVAGSFYNGSSSAVIGSEASVGRNVYFGGFSLSVEEGASIGRDVAAGGYQTTFNGEIGRDLYVGAASLEIGGTIGGDVKADVEGPPGEDFYMPFMPPGISEMKSPGIYIADDAEIGGEVSYTSPVNQSENIEASPEGGITFSTPVPDQADMKEEPKAPSGRVGAALKVGQWFLKRLREFVTLLALGALVLWLIPDLFNKVLDKTENKPLPATGWGLLTLIVGYVGVVIVGALILAIGIFFGVLTLGGLGRTVFGVGFSSLGFAFTLFLLLVNYGSKLVIAFWGGRWILGKLAPQAADSKVWPLVLGVVLYVILRGIPIIGWIFGLFVTLIGLGAMWLVFQDWNKSRKGVTAEAEATV